MLHLSLCVVIYLRFSELFSTVRFVQDRPSVATLYWMYEKSVIALAAAATAELVLVQKDVLPVLSVAEHITNGPVVLEKLQPMYCTLSVL
jgi:hypothetical protein